MRAPQSGSPQKVRLFAASGLEHEGIGDDDDTTLRPWELPATKRTSDTLLNGRVTEGRGLHDAGDNCAGRSDGEVDHDAAFHTGVAGQLTLVAELHFVDVTTNDAANQFLIERCPADTAQHLH